MIKIVALDFDGVIMDTAHEVFVACQKVLEERNQRLEDSAENRFRKGRNFLRSSRSLYGIAELTIQGMDFDKISQEDLDKFADSHESESIQFAEDFFAIRKRMQEEDYDRWFSLTKLFPRIKYVIEKISKKFRIVIISTKDFYSISTTFDRVGIDVDKENIFSKEISDNKAEVIKKVSEKLSVMPKEILFVDDQPKHLEDVMKLGVNVVLAGWGHNNDRQKEETRKLGIPVLEKPEDIEKEIKRLNGKEIR